MATPRILLATLLLAVAPAAFAQAEPPPDAAWLAGHWCGTQGDNRIEEWWIDRGGELLNLGVSTHGDALVSFEYLRIEPRAGGIVLVAQPNGEPPVEFALVDWGPERLVFENPEHDFPQQVSYWRDAAGLHGQIAGQGGDEERIGFDYVACNEPTPAVAAPAATPRR